GWSVVVTSVQQSYPHWQSPSIVLTLLHGNVIFPSSRSAVRCIRDTHRECHHGGFYPTCALVRFSVFLLACFFVRSCTSQGRHAAS
ncbi:hypothetical protein V8E53_012800, partial [Lactarius tabidus]